MPKSVYLEDHSLINLIKIARNNLRDMQPDFKVQVVDRILEIIEERVEANELYGDSWTDENEIAEIEREITEGLNEKTDSGPHVNYGHADKS